jgi:arylsulfatase A
MRLLLLPMVLASLALPLAADPDPRPNIIYILLDDIGINDVNIYSDQNLIETDTIDGLAAAGTMFTDYYSSSVCSTTRFALLTGAYQQRVNVRKQLGSLSERGMPSDPPGQVVTLGEMLKDAGYLTAHFGKWHVGNNDERFMPRNQGFDYSAMLEPFEYCMPSFIVDDGTGGSPPMTANAVNIDGHSTDLILLGNGSFDGAIDWIEDVKDEDEPFFVHIALWAPHSSGLNLAGDDDYSDMTCSGWSTNPYSEGTNCCIPGSPDGPFTGGFPQALLTKYINTDGLGIWGGSYAAVVHHADQRIGEFLVQLNSWGLTNNTIVIVAGDNGGIKQTTPIVTNGSYRAFKGDLYEGGIRSPMVVRWPNGPEGFVNAQNGTPLMAFDLLPTLAEAAEVTDPLVTDGTSFLPLLHTADQPKRETLFFENLKCNYSFEADNHMINDFAVREEDWKLVMTNWPDPTCAVTCGEESEQEWSLMDLSTNAVEDEDFDFIDDIGERPRIDDMFRQYLDWRSTTTTLPFVSDLTTGGVENLDRDVVSGNSGSLGLLRLEENQLYSFHDGEFSFSAWIQPLSLATSQLLADKDQSWRLRIGTDGKIRLRVWQDAVNTEEIAATTAIGAGTWHHVAFTIEGWTSCRSYARLFIDGVLEAESEMGATSPKGVPTNDYQTFVAGNFAGTQNFHGVLVDTELAVRALMTPEIERTIDSHLRFDSFETNSLSGWTTAGTGSKTVTTTAGLVGYYGVTLSANMGSETATLVDETPNNLRSFRGQLTVDLTGLTVPSGQVMNLVAVRDDSPATNLIIIRLRTNGGNLEAQLLSIDHQSSVTYDQSSFAVLGSGVKTLEVEWHGDPDNDVTAEGTATLKVNGSPFASLTGLDDWGWGADRAVMGFLHTVTGGSSQTLLIDHYKAYTTPAVTAPL